MWVGIAGVIALLASIFFDRFDPSRARTNFRRNENVPVQAKPQKQVVTNLQPSILSRLFAARPSIRVKNSFLVLVTAEFRLQIRGRSWWWYAVAAALFLACLFSPMDASRSGVILAAWIWPILLWSEMGTREARFSTTSLIYSARNAFPGQLLASWAGGLSGCTTHRGRSGIASTRSGRFSRTAGMVGRRSLYSIAGFGPRRLHRRQESIRSSVHGMVVSRSIASPARHRLHGYNSRFQQSVGVFRCICRPGG